MVRAFSNRMRRSQWFSQMLPWRCLLRWAFLAAWFVASVDLKLLEADFVQVAFNTHTCGRRHRSCLLLLAACVPSFQPLCWQWKKKCKGRGTPAISTALAKVSVLFAAKAYDDDFGPAHKVQRAAIAVRQMESLMGTPAACCVFHGVCVPSTGGGEHIFWEPCCSVQEVFLD